MTTITPPFTGSYATTLQGINVSRFDLFGISVAPKMGRDGIQTFLSSSEQIINVSSDVRNFFDDSIRPITTVSVISAVSGSADTATTEIISSDDYKIQELPSYRLSRQTYGIEKDFDASEVFHEMNVLDPVSYIRDPTQISYPIVIEQTSTVDPFDFNGAIEPFSIRKEIAGNSTFVGSYDDPEPTGPKAIIIGGGTVLNIRNKSVVISNFYDQCTVTKNWFEEIPVDTSEELPTDPEVWTLQIPYEADTPVVPMPFVDGNSVETLYKSVSNKEIRDLMVGNAILVDYPSGYPDSEVKSMPCGFDYQNSRGVDSIAYGGLLK